MGSPSKPTGNNATPPAPAIAPGSEDLDPRAIAAALGRRPEGPIDPRIPAAVPGFDAPFFQAGLAGYSDAAMRIIARRHGCPFCVTEALLDRTLLAGGRGFVKADLGELHDNVPGGPEDHPLACQIMGSDPREMAASALKAAEQSRRGDKAYRLMAYAGREDADFALDAVRLPGGEQLGRFDPTEGLGDGGDPDCGGDSCDAIDSINAVGEVGETPARDVAGSGFEVIDVNLACPVKKVEKKARGGHWLAEPRGAIAILEAVRNALPSEVVTSVKLRRAFDDTPEMAANCETIIAAAFDMGYTWVTIHGRTVQQKYIGPSRWDILKGIVQRHPGKLIFGSGDVWEVGDIFRMIAYTGVSAVAVARGCIGNPWIFRQARDMLAGRDPAPPTIAEQRTVLDEHFRLLLAVCRDARHGEHQAARLIRKFGIRFAEHHPAGEDVRRKMIAVSSLGDWSAVLEEFYGERHKGTEAQRHKGKAHRDDGAHGQDDTAPSSIAAR